MNKRDSDWLITYDDELENRYQSWWNVHFCKIPDKLVYKNSLFEGWI